ncbi:MAG: T9SS type A sorting domain-containing protein [Saprospirales bacterium]|nr:T9SS type A sorting domain-containing protein [Saprospirales bacterium]
MVRYRIFFRNPTSAPDAHSTFQNATISVNTTHFPGVSIPYNGMNVQGAEDDYNNYWLGISFTATTPQTYNQGQEYVVCTITLASAPAGFALELCHNEPFYSPHYLALTDEAGVDRSNLTGTNKFYGPGAIICSPVNCPSTTWGNNHILPLNGTTPVELVEFQASKYGENTARLDWRTASEVDFDAFAIERQYGQQLWSQIGEMKAAGVDGVGAVYTFFDENAPPDQVYYRLKMRDLDGSFEYSPIRSLRFEPDGALQIFPNPASDILNLYFSAGMQEEDILLDILNAKGQGVFQRRLAAAPDAHITISLQEVQLPAGAYLIRAVSSSGFRHTERIVVQTGH